MSPQCPKHYVVLQHGIEAPVSALDRVKESLQCYGPELVVLQPDVNEGQTLDGIVSGGERLADYIEEMVSVPGSTLSMVGHSLGGLYLRSALSFLEDRKFFDKDITTISFITLATPHLGVCHLDTKTQVGVLFTKGQTGSDLLLNPLCFQPTLIEMVNDKHLQSLQRFRYLGLYANTTGDSMVPYLSSMLALNNTAQEINIESVENHHHLLPPLTGPGDLSNPQCLLTEYGRRWNAAHYMLCRLSTLPWHRQPVLFTESNLSPHVAIVAHTHKDPSAVGKDVVDHLANEIYTHIQEWIQNPKKELSNIKLNEFESKYLHKDSFSLYQSLISWAHLPDIRFNPFSHETHDDTSDAESLSLGSCPDLDVISYSSDLELDHLSPRASSI